MPIALGAKDKEERLSVIKSTGVYNPQYHDLIELAKKHERIHWTEDEVKLQKDVEQWKTGIITDEEKALITNILRLFTQQDFDVSGGYYDKLIPVFKNNDVRAMLGSFAAREFIHVRGYALLSDTLGMGQEFYHEFLEYAEMKAKHEYFVESIGNSYSEIGGYIAKQVFLEGVSLFASFAILLNFDRLGKLPGMCDLNKWSILDEFLHAEGLAKLFRVFTEEHPRIVNDEWKKEIYETARTVVSLEDKFIDKTFSMGGVSNLDPKDVKKYIRYIADYRLKQLGLKPNWHIKENPLPWVDWLTGTTFGNFFEREIFEYSKANLQGSFAEGYPS